MRRFKLWSVTLLLLLLIGLVAACGGGSTESSKQQEQVEGEQGSKVSEQGVIKVGILTSLTGALEAYGPQTVKGFELGLEYATEGTMEVAGKKIEFIVEDTETQADVAVQKATRLLEEHQVDFIVGSSSSGDTLAVLPLMEEYKRVMIVDPAVADSITGANWNPYIFRTARNSSQDAISGAATIAGEGISIATLAQDNAFGRDGVSAFKAMAEQLGSDLIHEEYADPTALDISSNIQRIINAEPDYLFVIWAGSNVPWGQMEDMRVQERGIRISTIVPDIAALKTMGALIGMEGLTPYHYTLPNNEINDWFVAEHKARFNESPDIFTPGGFAAAMAIVTALKETNGNSEAELIIETMEGMTFDTPKGPMTFREEDHQALQTMYAITLEEHADYDYPLPVLVREITPAQSAPPINN